MANVGYMNFFESRKEEKDGFPTYMNQDEDNFPTNPSSSITDENEFVVGTILKEGNTQQKKHICATDTAKRVKPAENAISNFLKLKGFFEVVQKQHPESCLELQQVEGNWRVWCGACKKLLRPDKSGKAIHNIQRQHFTSGRHQKKLHQMLQVAEEAESARPNAVAKDTEFHEVGH